MSEPHLIMLTCEPHTIRSMSTLQWCHTNTVRTCTRSWYDAAMAHVVEEMHNRLTGNNPEKVSNVQMTKPKSNNLDQLKFYADMAICAIFPARLQPALHLPPLQVHGHLANTEQLLIPHSSLGWLKYMHLAHACPTISSIHLVMHKCILKLLVIILNSLVCVCNGRSVEAIW